MHLSVTVLFVITVSYASAAAMGTSTADTYASAVDSTCATTADVDYTSAADASFQVAWRVQVDY